MKYVSELYGIHKGEDIYVVGTGASLRIFPHEFLQDKVTIGLNMAWKVIPVKYCITIHPDLNIPEFMQNETSHPEITWICGTGREVNTAGDNLTLKGISDPDKIEYAKQNFYFFKYHGQPNTQPYHQPSDAGRILDWVRKPTDNYLYTWSSISQAAVNFAANLGAKNIILVGCDNCSLLNNHHSHKQHTRWKGVDPNQRYQQYYEGLVEVRSTLREREVNLLSLTPFVSLSNIEKDFAFQCKELKKPEFIENPNFSQSASSLESQNLNFLSRLYNLLKTFI
jgi:hypothetical protein